MSSAIDQEGVSSADDQEGVSSAEDQEGVLFCLCLLLSLGWFLKNLVGLTCRMVDRVGDDNRTWDNKSAAIRVVPTNRVDDAKEVGADICRWGDVTSEVERLQTLGYPY